MEDREFRKQFRTGSRWLRTNHVNPRAATPIEVTVIKTTPTAAILRSGIDSWHLTWPSKLGLAARQNKSGTWEIVDPEGRLLLTYTPLTGDTNFQNTKQAADTLLDDPDALSR